MSSNSLRALEIVTTCCASIATNSFLGSGRPTVAAMSSSNAANASARRGLTLSAALARSAMVPVMRATSAPQRCQYWRSPHCSTTFDATASYSGRRPCASTRAVPAGQSPSQSRSPQRSHMPATRILNGALPLRSAVLIATSSRSSWERSAFSTLHTALKSDPDST